MFKEKKETRSPIRVEEKPLRNPGESLERELDRLFEEEVAPYVAVITVMILWAAYEWWRWFFNPPPQPVIVTLAAILGIGFVIFKMIGFRNQIHSLQLGLESEKAVGQYLESLRSQGCMIFHDIPGEGFNIDHLIVSTRGVFTVETKTLSKSVKGNATIAFNGERILVGGSELKRDPVPQGLAERGWLQNLILNTTGRRFPVKAVVVFPGWYVEPQKNKKDEIWVLNHKALPKFIENEPVVIANEDVPLISSRISDYIRRYEERQRQQQK